jgi:hypothetical protein
MRTIAVLCDRVGDVGGAERYWETVLPAMASQGVRVRLLAREMAHCAAPGVDARALGWADDDGPPSGPPRARSPTSCAASGPTS